MAAQKIGPLVIDLVHRLANTKNGNPQFVVHIGNAQTMRTKADASVAYDLQNREYIGVPVMLTVERNRIIGVEKVTA